MIHEVKRRKYRGTKVALIRESGLLEIGHTHISEFYRKGSICAVGPTRG